MTNSPTELRRRLGVNIDHIATLRQARGSPYPDPIVALPILKACGVDQVTLHLREDRRHIQDADLNHFIADGSLPVNLELALTDEMISIAFKKRPATATFVPEKRAEITTEGGLDCVRHAKRLTQAVTKLQKRGIRCSHFIDADPKQVDAAVSSGAAAIEIHTGHFCEIIENHFRKTGNYRYWENPKIQARVERERDRIAFATGHAQARGLQVFAGHGLHVGNLAPIVAIPGIEEYNIGHAIIARAVFIGLTAAIHEIQTALQAP